MSIHRILSIGFISLILYSTGYYSQSDLNFNAGTQTESQLSEDSDDDAQEFRRTIKISIQGQPRTRCYHSVYDTSIQLFALIHSAKYHSHLQNLFSSIPSTRLLVALGSLII